MLSYFAPVAYIQVSPELLTIKNVKTGATHAEVPELAISRLPKPVIHAVGNAARAATQAHSAVLINPFAHPRTLVSDFTLSAQLIKSLLKKVLDNSLLAIAPCIIIHPLGNPAGGFTQVERRAFREMAFAAGASEVHVWTGRPLTDEEVLSRKRPLGEGEWE